jgi:hypothetical protein
MPIPGDILEKRIINASQSNVEVNTIHEMNDNNTEVYVVNTMNNKNTSISL